MHCVLFDKRTVKSPPPHKYVCTLHITPIRLVVVKTDSCTSGMPGVTYISTRSVGTEIQCRWATCYAHHTCTHTNRLSSEGAFAFPLPLWWAMTSDIPIYVQVILACIKEYWKALIYNRLGAWSNVCMIKPQVLLLYAITTLHRLGRGLPERYSRTIQLLVWPDCQDLECRRNGLRGNFVSDAATVGLIITGLSSGRECM